MLITADAGKWLELMFLGSHVDKVVVNGVDLLNRKDLSNSQNRELQRYIDENAHLLGFLDKEKEEAAATKENIHSNYNSYSLDNSRYTSSAGRDYDPRSTHSLGRVHSPAVSDYGGKRKGVSWSDGVQKKDPRARSHSPKRESENNNNSNVYGNGVGGHSGLEDGVNNHHHYPSSPHPRFYSPAYSTSDKRRTPFDYDHQSHTGGADSPWGTTGAGPAKTALEEGEQSDISAYSTLEKKPDDYNRYETYRHREQQMRRSQDRDDAIKFSGFGDHRVSGVAEIKPKPWTGGEVVTDPNIMYKSLKPRRLFYSPIGDGHERIVEKGSPGQAGRRVYEHIWDDGSGRRGDDKANDFGPIYTPLNDLGPGDGKDGRGKPNGDGDAGTKKRPGPGIGDGNGPGRLPPYGGSDDGLGGGAGGPTSRPNSALSIGTDGQPREGWTKTFIVNPRELISQYASETPTNIFDLEDHTPKTYTTYKEVISKIED
uniref:Uncharacterized protein n=1 Tax=Ditylenchus dipsaci TaxID=166011 RepID=A0A915D941_9BILA